MFVLSSLCAVVALLAQTSLSRPVDTVGLAAKRALVERTEAGPKVSGDNFPDPSIIYTDAWYAFATRTIGSSIHIQIATSTDFVTWSLVTNSDGSQRDALPNLPSWVDASSPNTWAPDINQLADGTFLLYYSASTNTDTTKHCVGSARSSSILGPYTPDADVLYCPLSQGGAIDASGYNDNGQRYVTYKIDGNSIGHGGACGNTVAPIVATPIILQPVEADGVTASGAATTILNNDGAADDGIIEAPSLVKSGSTYFLFFSKGCYTTGDYTVSYATAPAATGPYTRAASPLFQTGTDGLTAPGGADVTKDAERLVFHANNGSGRSMYTATITVSGTSVTGA